MSIWLYIMAYPMGLLFSSLRLPFQICSVRGSACYTNTDKHSIFIPFGPNHRLTIFFIDLYPKIIAAAALQFPVRSNNKTNR